MKRKDESQAKVGTARGIEAAIKVINVHIDNVDTCKYGCGAISIMMDSGKSIDKNNKLAK